MNKFDKILFTIGVVMALTGLSMSILKEPEVVTKVKSGEYTLECQFSDGWRTIPKEKVTGLDDIKGYWLFTNGYAKNCTISK